MKIEVKRVKIAVPTPKENVEEVREALCNAGAGTLKNSNYKYCSTCTKVLGTFLPCDGSNPYIGKVNELSKVEEYKIEVICEIDKVKYVLKELKKVHPYEEPAIDIIPLLDENDL